MRNQICCATAFVKVEALCMKKLRAYVSVMPTNLGPDAECHCGFCVEPWKGFGKHAKSFVAYTRSFDMSVTDNPALNRAEKEHT